jgi:hypothetical protein
MITKPKPGERLNSVNVYGVNESKRTVCSPSVCFTGGTLGLHKGTPYARRYELINKFCLRLISEAFFSFSRSFNCPFVFIDVHFLSWGGHRPL